MKKRYWSKFDAGTTAVVVGDPDSRGISPAYVASDQFPDGPIATGIKLDEWSSVEVVPVPESVPEVCWMVISGDDPTDPHFQVFASEIDAAIVSSKTSNSYGYVAISVPRTMVPAK